jgi:hypothetical protein
MAALRGKGGHMMADLEQIRQDRDLINDIDWEMTPEEAVTLYLEWGNNWSHGKMVRSKNDVSHYFVVDTWEDPPRIFLVRRNSEEAVELAAFRMPEELENRFLDSVGHKQGVYGLSGELKKWLKEELSLN